MKIYERRFETHISLGVHTCLAQDVIEEIENDTMMVFRPDDEDALEEVADESGALLINERATSPASIREWLPVVCQFIRWESQYDEAIGECDKKTDAAAYYRSNAKEVLWPEGEIHPAGPGALVAGIVLMQEKCVGYAIDLTEQQCSRLKWVLAHELVHAFHAMRFVVPAFLNWQTFWEKVLAEGARCQALRINADYPRLFLDDYGNENELGEVTDFWPSQAKKWFDAWH